VVPVKRKQQRCVSRGDSIFEQNDHDVRNGVLHEEIPYAVSLDVLDAYSSKMAPVWIHVRARQLEKQSHDHDCR